LPLARSSSLRPAYREYFGRWIGPVVGGDRHIAGLEIRQAEVAPGTSSAPRPGNPHGIPDSSTACRAT
jgi:hypothetical protein